MSSILSDSFTAQASAGSSYFLDEAKRLLYKRLKVELSVSFVRL